MVCGCLLYDLFVRVYLSVCTICLFVDWYLCLYDLLFISVCDLGVYLHVYHLSVCMYAYMHVIYLSV